MRLTLNLTHACNLACPYCFAGEARRESMPSGVGRAAIDRAVERAAARPGERLDVSFMGGEPLLAFDRLVELAGYARSTGQSAGVDVTLQTTTNGTLLDRARLEALAGFGVDLAISIDGEPEVHDRTRVTRTGAGTGEAVWRALDRAVERLGSVSVVCVIVPETVDRLSDTVRALAARGVHRIMLNPAWARAWSGADRDRWRRSYTETAGVYADAYRRGAPFGLNIFDEKIDLRIRGAERASFGCGFDPDEVAVSPSGRIFGCGRAVGEDLAPVPACDAPALEPEECGACVHRDRCASRCACTNRESSGDPRVPGELVCWHERMLIPIADGVAAGLFAERTPAFLKRFYGLEMEEAYATRTCHTL